MTMTVDQSVARLCLQVLGTIQIQCRLQAASAALEEFVLIINPADVSLGCELLKQLDLDTAAESLLHRFKRLSDRVAWQHDYSDWGSSVNERTIERAAQCLAEFVQSLIESVSLPEGDSTTKMRHLAGVSMVETEPAMLSLEDIAKLCGGTKRWLRDRRSELGPPDRPGKGRAPHKWFSTNANVTRVIEDHGPPTVLPTASKENMRA